MLAHIGRPAPHGSRYADANRAEKPRGQNRALTHETETGARSRHAPQSRHAEPRRHSHMRHHVLLLLACCGSPVLGFVPQMRHCGGPRPANRASLASPEEALVPSVSTGLSMKIRTPTAPIYPATLLVAAMLTASLLAPVQATAMGGGGASAGGGSYSPPPASSRVRSSTQDARTREDVCDDACEDARKTVALAGAGFLGYSAVESKSRAKMPVILPVRGRSRDSFLVKRRASVNSWPWRWFANKELELRPPNGRWVGTYSEGSNTAAIRYDLTFDYKEGTFSGSGSDVDGDFVVENGVFSPTTGRFEWTQRTKPNARYPCVTECVASASKVKADGLYGRPSSLDGNYASAVILPSLGTTAVPRRGPFSISPVA